MIRLKSLQFIYYFAFGAYVLVVLKTLQVLKPQDINDIIKLKVGICLRTYLIFICILYLPKNVDRDDIGIIAENIPDGLFIFPLSVEMEMSSRIDQMNASCNEYWASALGEQFNTPAFLWDEQKKLMYCQIPKTGCTYWRRLFAFLTLPEEINRLNITSPLEIDRKSAHDGPLSPKFGYTSWKYVQTEVTPRTLKFLFTRNPFTRLWSVFLDKYYLPDFWKKREFSKSVCPGNITFNEFLAFALASDDGHVSPVSLMCNPCAFQPHVIGKMETFHRDVGYILERVDLGRLASDLSFAKYTQAEIRSVVSTSYKVYRHHKVYTCLTEQELAKKLWRVFQLNGHIGDKLKFPEGLFSYSEESFLQRLIHTVLTQPLTPEESRKQKRTQLVNAYKSVPSNLILGIQTKFQSDFEIFGYGHAPPH